MAPQVKSNVDSHYLEATKGVGLLAHRPLSKVNAYHSGTVKQNSYIKMHPNVCVCASEREREREMWEGDAKFVT